MTLQELYLRIDGDYEQAIRILRMEKLMDKHIRKFIKNGVVEDLFAAAETMEPVRMFETAHAVKGVCANLGLTELSEGASRISEEYRPGSGRKRSDKEVTDIISRMKALYERTAEEIRLYEES